MIHRHRGNRRKQDWTKAERKKRIAREIYGSDYYEHDGSYKKGKIHCSCPMCAGKTNDKINRSHGPVDAARNLRVSGTNHRNGKNYKASDLRKVMRMDAAIVE